MKIFGRTLLSTPATGTAIHRGVRVGGCGCGRTKAAADVYRALGMRTHNDDLTTANWPAHIAEERAKLLPKLATLAASRKDDRLRQALIRLEDDHRVYLALLDKDLPLPSWRGSAHSTLDHAALEDALVMQYRRPLLELAAKTVRGGEPDMIDADVDVGAYTRANPETHHTVDYARAESASWPWIAAAGAGAATWWWLGPLAGLGALGAGAVAARYATTTPASSLIPPSKDGALGGGAFDARAYTDNSITEAELAAAAAHGDSAARSELQRRQLIKDYAEKCEALGPYGKACAEYASAGYAVAAAISKVIYEDKNVTANSPEQKKRLADAIGKIVSLGYMPTGFSPEMEFGAEDQANTILEDIDTIERGPTYVDRYMGTINIAAELTEAGAAARKTAGLTGLPREQVNALFLRMAHRRSPIGALRFERPVTLWDKPPTIETLSSEHPMLAYLAAAGAGKWNISIYRAMDIVADNAATFNERHGLVTRADTLSFRPFETTRITTAEAGPAILAEAWQALRRNHSKPGT